MQAVLGEQHMGKELGAGASARDRMRGRRRLRDCLTGPAGELLAYMRDHLPLARDELQRLGHVLADLAQSAIATAWADRRGGIDDAFARQMRRQRTARRLAPLERRHRDRLGHRFGLCNVFFQVGELKLKLVEQRSTLGGLSELLVPQLLDCVFELLDQQRTVLRLALRCNQRRPLRDDERMRTRKIGRKRIIDAHRQRWNHNIRRVSGRMIACRFKRLRLAGRLWTPGLLRHPPVDAFE